MARLAVVAGLDVVLSNSRGPETLVALVEQLGTLASSATVQEAARAADWVLLAIPFGAFPRIPAEPLAGKIVLETTNYFGAGGPGSRVVPSLELSWARRSPTLARLVPQA